jgi:RNA polymerase sigma-70 factor (ECF subfamily)
VARKAGEDGAASPLPPPVEAIPAVPASDAAFDDFYRRSWDVIARGLAATLGDPVLAGEATDEAMARAYERWATVGGYDFPTGWVYRVGLNWARSHHRRLARALPLRREEPAALGPIDDPSVRAALLELPVKFRSVVVCRLLLDWSVDETADALHIAPGTVKSRLSRALTVLGTTLGHMR